MLTMLVSINNNKTMKELIRKVLKESVYGKDLMEKGAVITAPVLTISFGILLIWWITKKMTTTEELKNT